MPPSRFLQRRRCHSPSRFCWRRRSRMRDKLWQEMRDVGLVSRPSSAKSSRWARIISASCGDASSDASALGLPAIDARAWAHLRPIRRNPGAAPGAVHGNLRQCGHGLTSDATWVIKLEGRQQLRSPSFNGCVRFFLLLPSGDIALGRRKAGFHRPPLALRA